jgi:hypothetical protein
VKDFAPLGRAARFDWPRWICGAVDAERGTVCGLDAAWKERPIQGSDLWWLRCDRHRAAAAIPIATGEPFAVTRLELRVAVASVPGDPRLSAEAAVRLVARAIEAIGGAVVGVHVVGQRASEPAAPAAVGRLQLGGPAEGGQRGDRPFWGNLASSGWSFGRRFRRTG